MNVYVLVNSLKSIYHNQIRPQIILKIHTCKSPEVFYSTETRYLLLIFIWALMQENLTTGFLTTSLLSYRD